MSAQIHHLHNAIANVAPINGISGDIRDHKNVKVHFCKEATSEQIEKAKAVINQFDIRKKYDPDVAAFLDELAQCELFSDAEFHGLSRALAISNIEARKKYISKNLAFSDNQKVALARLCNAHCITLPI